MIFATVGSSKTPFDRLIIAVDRLAAEISEEVIIQKGASAYIPKSVKYFNFCDSSEMEILIKKARIIIAHAGFGVITDCIRLNKTIILIPREHRFGDAEGIQVELAEHLARTTKGILCIRDVNQLKSAFDQIDKMTPDYHFTNKIPELIQNFIDQRLS